MELEDKILMHFEALFNMTYAFDDNIRNPKTFGYLDMVCFDQSAHPFYYEDILVLYLPPTGLPSLLVVRTAMSYP